MVSVVWVRQCNLRRGVDGTERYQPTRVGRRHWLFNFVPTYFYQKGCCFWHLTDISQTSIIHTGRALCNICLNMKMYLCVMCLCNICVLTWVWNRLNNLFWRSLKWPGVIECRLSTCGFYLSYEAWRFKGEIRLESVQSPVVWGLQALPIGKKKSLLQHRPNSKPATNNLVSASCHFQVLFLTDIQSIEEEGLTDSHRISPWSRKRGERSFWNRSFR